MIAILSDFGSSEFLGVMKGVVLKANPEARIVDLCNTIRPQGVREAAWVLLQAYSYFPKGTVFLCVVDPGVGSGRKAVAVKTSNYYFVGPDNGLMHPAIKEDGFRQAVELDTSKASKTFHGRDVFAGAAAVLEKRDVIESVGVKPVNSLERLEFFLSREMGEIVRIDSFGNVVTNIAHSGKEAYEVRKRGFREKLKFCPTYAEAEDDGLFLIEGSSDTLEISMKGASAAEKLKATIGERISIQ